MQADGRITVHDADEVRRFAAFLADAPSHADRGTEHGRRSFLNAWAHYYPDDYARALQDGRARPHHTGGTMHAITTHDENTLNKVYEALLGSDYVYLSRQQATDLINRMQNAGLVFRERVDHPTTVALYETEEAFYGAEPSDTVVIRDNGGEQWQAWSTEDGDWYVTRPRNEDDGHGPDEDINRPIGPLPLDALPLPWTVWQLGYSEVS
ncbi:MULTISPECIES: hypothetical protein [unclassified Aeromicrobium]|uniref:hypothetical protein n=1 Tax=unclassified Aeromicrobium TaxID=2633570 RepID=UPI00288B588E|nr:MULTISPECIES: hypothetical protein [unclassified Aeromicrobium]